MMKKFFSLFLAFLMAISMTVFTANAESTPTLYIIGDASVAELGEGMYPAQGWGEYFKDTVEDINAVNKAIPMTNMTTYISEGYWAEIVKNLKSGDFVVASFGVESIDARGKSQYSKALTKLCLDAKRKGAQIILVTPAPITASLEANKKLTPMMDSMKKIGKMFDVPVIDLNAKMLEGVESDADLKSIFNSLYLSNTQKTYYKQRGTISSFADNYTAAKTGEYVSVQGAKYVANVIAREIYSSDTKLSKYMKNVDDPTQRPVHFDVLNSMSTGEIRGILYDGMEYKGMPTQVFAYLGIPEGVTAENPAPAMVLVHGGGGKAYRDWVEMWVDRGYVALSYYFMESQASTDNTLPDGNKIYYDGGPRRGGSINDEVYANIPEDEQWFYHAAADASLAYTLLDSLPEVKDGEIGISGISWGAVVTASVIGRDTRFKLAMPIYGAGYLDENKGNIKFTTKWDGKHNFDKVKASGMKTLWINSPTDHYFDVTTTTKSSEACGGESLILYMFNHGEPSAAGLGETYNYADSVFRGGASLPKVSVPKKSGNKVTVQVESSVPIESAAIYYTPIDITYNSSGCENLWLSRNAEISGGKVTAEIPNGTKGYYIEVKDTNGNRMTTGYQQN